MLQLDKFQSGKIEKIFVLGLFSLFILIVFFFLIVGIRQFQTAMEVFQSGQEEREVIEYLNDYIYTNDTSEAIGQIKEALILSYGAYTFTVEAVSNDLLYISYTDTENETHSFYFFLHSQEKEELS